MRSGERPRGGGKRRENKERGESGRKGSNMKRGQSCVKTKTKTKTGLVTAMVGAAGLALSLGPLYSHPREAGPLQQGRGWLVNLGLGEGGLGECWTAEDLAPWPGQIMGQELGWEVPLTTSDTVSQH